MFFHDIILLTGFNDSMSDTATQVTTFPICHLISYACINYKVKNMYLGQQLWP